MASAISSLQREGVGGGGDGGGRKEGERGSRGDVGGLGGKGNSMRESRRTGWGASSTTREGFLVRGDSVARGSLRKTDEQLEKLYKHSVAESDSESTGYASISFSDSDIGSDDQTAGSEDIAAVVVMEEDKEEEEEEGGEGDLEMETVAEGDRDRRQESETRGVSLGRVLPPVQVVSKPQGHVGFSSLPDQVKDCEDDVDIIVDVDVGFSSLAGVKQCH